MLWSALGSRFVRRLFVVVVAVAVLGPVLVPAPSVEAQTSNLVPNSGFESGFWTKQPDPGYPGTSMWHAGWGSAKPRTGTRAGSISNHGHANALSTGFAVDAGASYDVHAWLRGHLDVASASQWQVHAVWYDSAGAYISRTIAAAGSPGSISPTWAQHGKTVVAPAGAAQAKVRLHIYLASGWVAYDDVTFVAVGGGDNLVPSPGFEDGANWTHKFFSAFPNTSIYRSNWGTAAGRNGGYATVMSNHAYGTLESTSFPVSGGADYDFRAKLRGEIEQGAGEYWVIRAYWYDGAGALIGFDAAAMGGYGSLDAATWSDDGGVVTAPANAADARVHLMSYMMSGWVAFDDVRVTATSDPQTNLVPDPSFEDAQSGWNAIADPGFPGTSMVYGTSGVATPVDGNYAWAISNLATGYLETGTFSVDAGAQYQAEAWLRGETDPATHGDWAVRVAWYDNQGNPVDADPTEAATGGEGTLTTTYALQGGPVTAPPDATDARFEVYVENLSGWVGIDDASVVEIAPPPPPPPPPQVVATPSPLDATIVEGSNVLGTIELTSTTGDPLPFDLFDDSDIIAGYFPASGTTPATVTVYTHSFLEKGFHTGYITGTVNVDVNLTITGPIPELGASPSPVEFPATGTGMTSDHTLTLSSLGSGDDGHIVVDAIAVTGTDAAEFSTAFSGPITLVPAATSDVTVTFAPQTEGAKAAQLEVTHNGPNSPLVVPLDAPQPATLGDATVLMDPATVTTAAGDGTTAVFGSVRDVAFFTDDVFVGDSSAVRRYDPGTGQLTVFAGSTTAAGCVEGTGAAARFDDVVAIEAAADAVYVVDGCSATGSAVRKVTVPGGTTTTLSEPGEQLHDLTLAVDGNLYATTAGLDVLRIDVATGAATVHVSYPASDPTLGATHGVHAISADSTDLWVAADGDPDRIDAVSLASGTITTLLADESVGLAALASAGDHLYGTGVGAAGPATTLRRYDKSDGSAMLVAGSGAAGFVDGVETEAWLAGIAGIATDGQSLWLADDGNLRLRKADDGPALPRARAAALDREISVPPAEFALLAGSGNPGTINGDYKTASFSEIHDIVVSDGAAYVAEQQAIRQLDLVTGDVSTFAGVPGTTGCLDAVDPLSATFATEAVTTDGSYLYTLDACPSRPGHAVRRVSLATGAVSTVAEVADTSNDLTFGPDGYIYVAGTDPVVLRVDPVDGTATTVHDSGDGAGFLTATADAIWLVDYPKVGRLDLATLAYTEVADVPEGLQVDGFEAVGSDLLMSFYVGAPAATGPMESPGAAEGGGDGGAQTQSHSSGSHRLWRLDPASGQWAFVGRGGQGLASDGAQVYLGWLYQVGVMLSGELLAAGGYDPHGAWQAGVNTVAQNFVTTHDDISVATAGPPLAVSRTYNSRDRRAGPFGIGWSFDYGLTAELHMKNGYPGSGAANILGISITYPDGRREFHTRLFDGSFQAPEGSYAELTGDPLVAPGIVVTQKDRTAYHFEHFGFDPVSGTAGDGRFVAISDANGRALTLAYDAQDQLDTVTDDAGRVLDFTWADGHITQVATESVAQHLGPLVWKYYYDGDLLTEACDPRNNAPSGSCTKYQYVLDRLTEIRRVMGNVEAALGYNGDGSVQWRADGLNNVTTFEYPELGRVEVTDPRGHTTIHEYDVDELRLTRETDPAGGVTAYGYDADGNRDSITDANGNVVAMDYDARGNLISTTNPELETTHFAYDAEDNLTDVRDPRSGSAGSSNWDTFKTTYTYDTAGNRLSERNAVGDTTNWTYTDGTEPAIDGGTMPRGLVETMLTPKGGQTTYEYDRFGDLRRVTGPTGLVTDSTYDEIGRLLSEVSFDAVVGATTGVWHGYDQVSNPVVVTESAVTNVVTGESHQLQVTRVFDGNGNVTQVIEADIAGSDPTRTTLLAYDANDREFRVTDPETGELERQFDAAGNVTSVKDQEGRVVETTYDSRNLPETVVAKDFVDDPVAGTTSRDIVMSVITYDATGRRLTETDAEGRVTEWSYDKADRVEKVTLLGFDGAEGPRDIVLEEYAYDPAGNPFSEKYGSGKRVVSNTYDPVGRLKTATLDPGGLARATTLVYDANGNVESVTLADGQRTEVTTYVFDSADRLERAIVENGAVDLETIYGYDQRGNLISVTDPRGATTDFENDLLGRRVRTTAPSVTVVEHGTADVSLRPETATGYDTWVNPTHTRDARGFVTEMRYDGLGRRTEVRHPAYTDHDSVLLQPVELFEYDKVGNLESRTSRRGAVTDYLYDAFNRLVQQTDPLVTGEVARGVVRHTYDDVGNRESTVDQRGARTEWEYDDLNRVRILRETVRQPSGPDDVYETTYLYDDLGNVNHTTYPDQSTTSALHNAASELESTTDQLGQVTSYEHDVAGRRTRVEDPSGRATEWVYDQAGRLEREQRWIDQTQLTEIVYGTDPNGNVDSVTTALGYETVFGFDALNRLTSVTVPVGPAEEIVTSYGYDAAGNRTEVVDGRGNAWSTTYQSWNLVADYHEPDVTPAQGGTFTTWYDAGGLPVREDQPGGVTIARTFDEFGRLTGETGSGGAAASRSFGYDLAGLRTEVSHPDGDLVFTYDDRGLMTEVVPPAGAPGYGATFVYDELGRLKERADAAGTTSFAWTVRGELDTATDPLTGTVVDYDWDVSGRLQTVDYGSAVRTVAFDDHGRLDTDTLRDAAAAVVAAFDYGYDADDNVRTVDVTLPGNPEAGLHSYDYDHAGRLEQWTSPASGTVAYDWDASGNRRQAGADVYDYDARNRLTSGPQGSYTYSARGTLVSITDGPDTTTFGFDALGRLVDYDGQVAYGYDGLDRVATRAGVDFGYTGFGLDPTDDGQFTYSRTPGGRVLAQSDGATAALTGLNRHGDLSYLFGASGAVSDTFVYDPFGVVAGATGASDPTIGFQGDYTDPTSGDVWMGARWYSPSDAAFRSRDTVFGELATPVTLNRYTYAGANPLSYWDPDGRRLRPLVDGICATATSCLAQRENIAENNYRGWVIANARQEILDGYVDSWSNGETLTAEQRKGIEAYLLDESNGMARAIIEAQNHEAHLAMESLRTTGGGGAAIWVMSFVGSVTFTPIAAGGQLVYNGDELLEGVQRQFRERGPLAIWDLTGGAVLDCVGGIFDAPDAARSGASAGCVATSLVGGGVTARGALRGLRRAPTVAAGASASGQRVAASLRAWFRFDDAPGSGSAAMPRGPHQQLTTSVADNAPRPATAQPVGGNGVVLRDGAGATAGEIAASTGGPTGGSRAGQSTVRQQLLDDADGVYQCWRCGEVTTDMRDVHVGHRNVATARGGNLSPANVCLEGAACNLSAGHRGVPTPGMSCAERGGCGAPYGRFG